ncbi:hypothetical protein CANCADRAFT_47 [Tortispora caseinolytica NRRL Y-17796]|uniref:Uncharacterized protein n=1 Tax=Tortispora caseinolytica NRRL Y-17796 TaxID=767744 RepID=A0A1E4TI89_9ASCO|nr:hypothetical protein CANCADRAFT_47 [Tortispora caseinolytica NRRL Y-17796]
MGCASSKPEYDPSATGYDEEKALNDKLQSQMTEYSRQAHQVAKILLLGAGESGKTTILKQMEILHSSGFSDPQKLTYRQHIYSNIILGARILADAVIEVLPSPDIEQLRAILYSDEAESVIMHGTPLYACNTIVHSCISLWDNAQIQAFLKVRPETLQLDDGGAYFLDDLAKNPGRILAPNFLPTDDDILHVRVRTTGIVEKNFKMGKLTYKMIDVGGQRNERRKWIQCFDDVTSVLFVVSLCDYAKVLAEDPRYGRLSEDITLFKAVTSSHFFSKASIILFLNKTDLFEQMIPSHPLSRYLPQYTGPPNDANAAAQYIKNLILSESAASGREVYTHFTCATDSKQINFVLNAISDTILQTQLRSSGLL